MPRARASAAAEAFGRVGTAAGIPADSTAGDEAGISVSENTSGIAVLNDDAKAAKQANRNTSKKAGKKKRRVGRPRGPERVPLTIRILAGTDERLTAAVESTGESPQYIVDAALGEYLTRLGY